MYQAAVYRYWQTYVDMNTIAMSKPVSTKSLVFIALKLLIVV
jgi:hypothetical protein